MYDLVDFSHELSKHLTSVTKLTHSRKLNNLVNKFENSPINTNERENNFKKLKSHLQSNVNKNIDSHTTILNISGKTMVDDISAHATSACSYCHASSAEPDVLIAKLRFANMSVKMNKYSPQVKLLSDDVSREDLQTCEEIKKVIKRYIKKEWIFTTTTNLYSKLIQNMPEDHPKLPVYHHICFTKEVDKSYINEHGGEGYILKTYVKIPGNIRIQ